MVLSICTLRMLVTSQSPVLRQGQKTIHFSLRTRDRLGRLNQADRAGKKFQAFLSDSRIPSVLMDVPSPQQNRGTHRCVAHRCAGLTRCLNLGAVLEGR